MALALFESLLLDWNCGINQDVLEVGISRLLSTWKDKVNERRWFLCLSRGLTDPRQWFRSFWSCFIRCECLSLDFSLKLVTLDAEGEQSRDNGFSPVSVGFGLSSSSAMLTTCCPKNAAMVGIMSGSRTNFTISACINIFDGERHLMFLLYVLSRSPRWITSSTMIFADRKEEF